MLFLEKKKGYKMLRDNYDRVVEYIVENQEKFYRLAFSYVKNQEDALDVVQNAICRALENCSGIRDKTAIKTWFYRVLVNESINYIRKNRKEMLLDEETMETMVYHELGYDEKDDFYDEINRMELETQNIIKLRFYEEMSLKEIAEITQLNINTVKAKLYRGLKILGQEIQEVNHG